MRAAVVYPVLLPVTVTVIRLPLAELVTFQVLPVAPPTDAPSTFHWYLTVTFHQRSDSL